MSASTWRLVDWCALSFSYVLYHHEDVFGLCERDKFELILHGHHRRLGYQHVDSLFDCVLCNLKVSVLKWRMQMQYSIVSTLSAL